ncbi:hypothetical protein CEG14_05195 [Bordetella genomosp. 1]|uniref:Lipoprotein n=1 Tax=Bordetella genomosp. 1 TaxID=1395607 RepID=A0A261SNG7_9BORD|nr:hypothetical protein [Bordetella genomosp. 1]MDQ8033790.1 hypothetical protein [Bordetella sp.]OZI38938.1 hypothetical protein CEG14_05195 [Bordetella genomosp. 1]OZI65217.1 hypothetical protein CAL27_09185 [Bordetella genomosp. 1]
MKVSIALPLAAATLMLTACANVKDISNTDPVFYGSTARPAAEYLGCVAAAWKGQGVDFHQTEIKNGGELVVDGTLGVEAVLSATTWRGKTDARLTTRRPSRAVTLSDSANLCL